jgi:hypothetical protein
VPQNITIPAASYRVWNDRNFRSSEQLGAIFGPLKAS